MKFEAMSKLRNVTVLTNPTEKAKVLTSKPITGNVSGLIQGDIIAAIGDYDVVSPIIQGQTMSPAIVMECTVVGTNGKSAIRPIYLSTLIRKIDLNADYRGLIGSHANFAGSDDFSNEQWFEAFKKTAPFSVVGVNSQPREINVEGGTRKIQVKELELAKVKKSSLPADTTAPKAPATTEEDED